MPAVVKRSTASRTVATEGPWRPQWFLDVLDVGTERRRDEHASDVDAPHHAVEPGAAMAQAFGKLQRSQQQRTGAGDAVLQQPPPDSPVALPDRFRRIDQETLVVADDVSHHQGDDGEDDNLRGM